jgi:DNA-binding NtrC family response regulator
MGSGSKDSARESAPPPMPSAGNSADPMEQILAKDLPWPRARQAALDEFTRRYVERTLARYGGSTTRAAAASGIALRYFRVLRSRQGG